MKKFYALVASCLMVVATMTVAPASWLLLISHPKTPKCLLK